MPTNETAKATVYLDGKQAETALKSLATEAEKFQKEMKQALAEGDMKKFKTAETNLKATQKAMGGLRKEMFSVDKVMKDLSGSSLNDLQKALRKTNSEMNRMKRTDSGWEQKRKQASLLNNEIRKVRMEMGKMQSPSQRVLNTVKGWLPAFGATAIIGGLKAIGTELFSLTKQMQGDAVRSATVFGNQLGYVEEEAAKVAKQMGLTNREFVANAAATADLLIPLDFSREASAKMSVELQRLTGALDEWTGGSVGAAEVSNILTKAMLGENEQLKQLGIAIQMDSKEFKDLVKIKMEAGDVTTAQAKAMATLELITKKSADAQAAYNKEGNKLLRLQKSISVWWKNLKEGVVEYFDELINSMSVEDRMKSFNDNIQTQQRVMNTLFETIKDTTVSEEARKEAMNKLNTEYSTYLPHLITEKTTLTEITIAQDNANKALLANLALKRKTSDIDAVMAESMDKQQELSKSIMSSVDEKSPGLGGVFYQEYMDLIDESIKRGDAFNIETQRSIGDLARKYKVSFMDIFEATKETFEIRNQESKQIEELTNFYDAYINKYKDFIKTKEEDVTVTPVGGGEETTARNPDMQPIEGFGIPKLDRSDELLSKQEMVNQAIMDGERMLHEYTMEMNEAEYQDYLEKLDQRRMARDAYADATMMGLDALAGFFEASKNRELAAAGDNERKKEAIQKKYARKEQLVSSAQATIAGALAIMRIWEGKITGNPIIDTPIKIALTAAQTATTGAQLAVINSAKFGSKKEGGYTGSSASDDEPMGIYHANEFVANAKAVRNPQVKQVLDVIDVAQKNGTITTIDLPRAITGQMPGRAQSNAADTSAASTSTIPPEFITILQRNAEAIERLERNGVKGIWDYDYDKESRDKMNNLMDDVGA